MADMMYRLVLRAKFENQEELQRVINGLQQLQVQGANVSVTMGKAGETGKISLEGIARSAMSVGFMYNMLESAAMRAQMATMLLDSAQERYNNTVAKYGRNSREAAQAAKELEQRTEYLNAANMRANVSMGLMCTNLILQTGLLNASTRAKIMEAAASAYATIKHGIETSAILAKAAAYLKLAFAQALASPWLMPAMLAAIPVVAGAAYYIGSQAALPPAEQKIDVTVTDEDIIRDYMRRRGGNSIKGTG